MSKRSSVAEQSPEDFGEQRREEDGDYDDDDYEQDCDDDEDDTRSHSQTAGKGGGERGGERGGESGSQSGTKRRKRGNGGRPLGEGSLYSWSNTRRRTFGKSSDPRLHPLAVVLQSMANRVLQSAFSIEATQYEMRRIYCSRARKTRMQAYAPMCEDRKYDPFPERDLVVVLCHKPDPATGSPLFYLTRDETATAVLLMPSSGDTWAERMAAARRIRGLPSHHMPLRLGDDGQHLLQLPSPSCSNVLEVERAQTSFAAGLTGLRRILATHCVYASGTGDPAAMQAFQHFADANHAAERLLDPHADFAFNPENEDDAAAAGLLRDIAFHACWYAAVCAASCSQPNSAIMYHALATAKAPPDPNPKFLEGGSPPPPLAAAPAPYRDCLW